MDPVGILVTLFVLAVVVWGVVKVLALIPVDQNIKSIAYLILFVLVVFVLLDRLGVYHAGMLGR